jgi:periplasmic protein TonB
MNSVRTVALLVTVAAVAGFGQDGPKKVTRQEAMSAVLSKVAPQYPPMARQLKIEGAVELQATVTESGAVEEVTITSGNPVLTKPAVEAVKKWKFAPFVQDGKAVKAMAPLTVIFKM